MTDKFATCNKCGWVHFTKTIEEVAKELDTFNAWFMCQSAETKHHYGNKPSQLINYISCFRCNNNYKDFHDYDTATDADVYGSTIQPILSRMP